MGLSSFGRKQLMATAVHFRPLVLALLALCSFSSILRADDILQPPQIPAPGSVGELFTPSPLTPPGPVPTPPPSQPPQPFSPPPSAPLSPPATPLVTPASPGAASPASPLLESMKPGDLERRRVKKTDTKDWG